MKLELKRITDSHEHTYGALLHNGKPLLLTLERPWLSNMRNVSCIPKGNYLCKRIVSPTFGDTFIVMDVPNRSHILFHKGNQVDDSEGCILVGRGLVGYDDGIKESSKAFEMFMQLLREVDEFELTIS